MLNVWSTPTLFFSKMHLQQDQRRVNILTLPLSMGNAGALLDEREDEIRGIADHAPLVGDQDALREGAAVARARA